MSYSYSIHQPGNIALIQTDDVLIMDDRDAVDFIATMQYKTGCDAVVLPMTALSRAFFVLSNGLAGAVLQKFVIYNMRVAIVGDFSSFTSKPLRDFIRESNEGRHVYFAPTPEDAIKKLQR